MANNGKAAEHTADEPFISSADLHNVLMLARKGMGVIGERLESEAAVGLWKSIGNLESVLNSMKPAHGKSPPPPPAPPVRKPL